MPSVCGKGYSEYSHRPTSVRTAATVTGRTGVGRCEYSEYPWVTVRGLAEPDSIVAHTFVAHSKGALSIVLARDRSLGCERAPRTFALSAPRN
jgi:hypothetical protein